MHWRSGRSSVLCGALRDTHAGSGWAGTARRGTARTKAQEWRVGGLYNGQGSFTRFTGPGADLVLLCLLDKLW